MSDADAVRALYERQPFPPPGGPGRRPVLSTSWVDGAVHPAAPVTRPGSRALVAGCGSGEEAVALAAGLPGVEVVGVDFSAAALARGRAAAEAVNVRLVEADLAGADLVDRLGRFELIVCSAVADYVPDRAALLRNLGALLADDGALYFAVNSAHHPARRVQAGLRALGHSGEGLPDDGRASLRALAALMGDQVGIPELGELSDDLLGFDVFPPFAHHLALADWVGEARAAGLHLLGSAQGAAHLARVAEADLPALMGLDRGELALLVAGLRFDPASFVLFGRRPPLRPPWRDLDALGAWTMQADPALRTLPPIDGGWDRWRAVGVAGDLAPVSFGVPSPALEVVRRCAAPTPLWEARAGLADPGADAAFAGALFRLWHANLVRLAPPAGAR